jgi:hypothetical protein
LNEFLTTAAAARSLGGHKFEFLINSILMKLLALVSVGLLR